MFKLVENRLYAYADDSTLLAVVLNPADILGVAASFNRDFAWIQDWCNHWCTILNPNKNKALWLVDPGLRTLPMVTLVFSGISICYNRNLDILGPKFDSRLNFEDHVRDIASPVSQRLIF